MSAPLFTVIMPVYLQDYGGHYGKSATDKVSKFHRAVDSVKAQTFRAWELVIVVDGCEVASQEAARYDSDPMVKVVRVPKQRRWGPQIRNIGLDNASPDASYAAYLDADDRFGRKHLDHIYRALSAANWPNWGAMDELVWDDGLGVWKTRTVAHLRAIKRAGTQNFVHRSDMGIRWPSIEFRYPEFGYGVEDRAMFNSLSAYGEPIYIPGSEYYVMHIPRLYDL